jgi:hypothetical protein
MIDLTMSSDPILDASGTRAAVGSRTSALGSANGGGAGSPASIGSDVATICCSIFLNSCNGIPGETKLDPEWLMIRFILEEKCRAVWIDLQVVAARRRSPLDELARSLRTGGSWPRPGIPTILLLLGGLLRLAAAADCSDLDHFFIISKALSIHFG